jgi:diguanylate cyclase (GGDEF)-like protein
VKHRFSELVDISKLQELMGSLYWLTDIAIGIVEADGTFLFCAGWRDACTAGKLKACDCMDYIAHHLDSVSYTYKRCPTGMLHYACPIVVEDEHLASVYIGQFFTEPPDQAAIQLEAIERGIDPLEYQKALQKIPIIPSMRLSLLLKYLKDLANMLAEIGLQRLRQMETLELLKINEERLQYLSTHDPLTGLLNRSCFENSLNDPSAPPELPITIMVCDLDSLKLVNDTLGHPVGDALLQTAATILQEVCPFNAIVSRIGGDEFAILMPQTGAASAHELNRLIQTKVDHHNAQYENLPLGISIGWAVAESASFKMRALFNQADAAMYRDKSKNLAKIRSRFATKYSEAEILNE